jgi:hypothetical protein
VTCIGARATIANVGVLIATQRVVAVLTQDDIVILLALEGIVASSAHDAVITITAA